MFLYKSVVHETDEQLTAEIHKRERSPVSRYWVLRRRGSDHGDDCRRGHLSRSCYRLFSSEAGNVPAFTVLPVAVYLVSSKAPNDVW